MGKIHSRIQDTTSSYSSWHRLKSDHHLHWLVFILMVSVLSLLIISREQQSDYVNIKFLNIASAKTVRITSNIDVAKMPELTKEMLNLAKSLRQAEASEKSALLERLKVVAQSRRDLLLSVISSNPKAAHLSAVNNSLRAQMPLEIRSLIEQKATLRGAFEHLHIHWGDFGTGEPEDQFFVVEEGTNKRYRVYLNGDPNVLTDDIVEIDGLALGDQLAAEAKDIKFIGNKPKPEVAKKVSLLDKIKDFFHLPVADAATTVTKKKVAVIMINWQNDTRTPYTEDQIRGRFFTSSTSANAYYKENSFGWTELIGSSRPDGDVFGWITVPYDNTNCNSMYSTWSQSAEDILAASGVDLSVYNIKTYFFARNSTCGWGGLGYVGGDPTRSWINSTGMQAVIHELGHNLGAHHSGSWLCSENSARVSVSADVNCTLDEYGDIYDVMGFDPTGPTTRHMNNYHKGQSGSLTRTYLNWFLPENTQTLDRHTNLDGIYTLNPIEQVSSGIQSLRVPRLLNSSGVATDYYYLEARKPVGFDSAIGTYATNGIFIRIAPNYNSITKSKLIDTHPETTTFNDAPLSIGQTFNDPYNNINITLLAMDSGVATVQVTFGALPCVNSFPSVVVSPSSQAGDPGSTLSYNVKVTNNDSIDCNSSSYVVTPTLPNSFLQSPAYFVTNELVPGASQTVTVNITAPDSTSYGNYNFSERAESTYDSSLYAVSSAIFSVTSPDAAPTVSIVKPVNGSKVPTKGNLSITANATDDKKVSSIEISLDSKIIKKCMNTTSCSVNYKISSISNGTHTIYAKATDSAGNNTTTSIVVTK